MRNQRLTRLLLYDLKMEAKGRRLNEMILKSIWRAFALTWFLASFFLAPMTTPRFDCTLPRVLDMLCLPTHRRTIEEGTEKTQQEKTINGKMGGLNKNGKSQCFAALL